MSILVDKSTRVLCQGMGKAGTFHALQCREPDWSAGVDWDPSQSAQSRRRFFGEVADTDAVILPVHFPSPTAGRIEGDGDRFRYRFRTE